MKIYKIFFILPFLMNFIYLNSSQASPSEYKATYTFEKNGITFAESKHKMTYDKKNDYWCINTKSKSIGIFSLKKDERLEDSCFVYELSKNYESSASSVSLTTLSYTYTRSKSQNSSRIESKEIDGSLITYLDKKIIKHGKDITIDRLVAQIFGYSLDKIKVSDKGRERYYKFSTIGYENLDTVIGNVKTIIIKKEIEGSKRSTITWYSSDTNYLPIKIEQYRLDELKFTAILKSYER